MERVNEAGGELTVEEMHHFPRGGFGDEMDRVLHLDEDERMVIVRGFVKTFSSARPEESPAE